MTNNAKRTVVGVNGRTYAFCTSDSKAHTGRPFKARPSAPCSVCGDDGIPNVGAGADYTDRIRFDLDQDWPYF